jgi:hypothetical protein
MGKNVHEMPPQRKRPGHDGMYLSIPAMAMKHKIRASRSSLARAKSVILSPEYQSKRAGGSSRKEPD